MVSVELTLNFELHFLTTFSTLQKRLYLKLKYVFLVNPVGVHIYTINMCRLINAIPFCNGLSFHANNFWTLNKFDTAKDYSLWRTNVRTFLAIEFFQF